MTWRCSEDYRGRAAAVFAWVWALSIIWPSNALAAPQLSPVLRAAADAALAVLAGVTGTVLQKQANHPEYHMPAEWCGSCQSAFQLLSRLLSIVGQEVSDWHWQLPSAVAFDTVHLKQHLIWTVAELQLYA